MNRLLEKIIASKKEEISTSRFKRPLTDLKSRLSDQNPKLRLMEMALDPGAGLGRLPHVRIIAEIKKASPSAGILRPEFDPVQLASEYLRLGAAAISVLTDPTYFGGNIEDLLKVREMSPRPVLRKDFLIDPYQIYESKAFGADCILLIARILEQNLFEDLYSLAKELRLSILVEVHDEEDLAKALSFLRRGIIGINHRNLDTLEINLSMTAHLRPKIPAGFYVVAESGISSREEIDLLRKAGADGFLIGEVLLKSPNLETKFKELISLPDKILTKTI